MTLTAFCQKLALTFDMIKIKHSVFAMPFALASLLFATKGHPSAKQLTLITLCMITARNAAMTFNRIVDRDIDGINPRTQNRPLPSGLLSLKFSAVFCFVNCISFILISTFFNKLTVILSPLALSIILGYSFTKRFTNLTQLFLGLSLGISPLATWIAITGNVSLFSSLLAVGVFFWVVGFDLIYSCQDHDFDKKHGLKNIVVKFGIKKSLIVARICHTLSIGSLILAGVSYGLGPWFFAGLVTMSICLIYEHSLVHSNDLSRVDTAFFTLNGYVSLCFLLFSSLEIYLV